MRPKRGTKNQKIGSWEPKRRSFLVKSMADSVALPPKPKRPLDAGLGGAALEMVIDIARKVSANINTGSEDLRQRSRDSVNVMKMPAPD